MKLRRWTGWPPARWATCCPQPGAVIMVGERLATAPGGLSAAARLADATGARLAWVPRRAGERGALEAGALPGLLPGGRPLADDAARAQVCAGVARRRIAPRPGRDVDGILAAAADGTLGALLVGGIEPADFADPDAVLAALDAAGFVVSLELRHSAVTERADVVFPVAPTTQKAGAFVNWEGRYRPIRARAAGQHAAGPPVGSPGARHAGRRNGRLSRAFPRSKRPARSWPRWASGTANAPQVPRSRPRSQPSRDRVRPC